MRHRVATPGCFEEPSSAAVPPGPHRRHALVWPTPDGRDALDAGTDDPLARACLDRWRAIDAPLVVTRQPADLPPDRVAVGLPAPARFGRRRIAATLSIETIARTGPFPRAAAITASLPVETRSPWRSLIDALDGDGAELRVHGGHGWQALTGESYLHPGSDLDLLALAVDAASADRIADRLARAPIPRPRLDGELLFTDGAGIAWREWRRHRAGEVDRVLVKRFRRVVLETRRDEPAVARPAG